MHMLSELRTRVERFVRRRVATDAMAADLTQETFLRLARTEEPPIGIDATAAWLFTTARRLVIDQHRRTTPEFVSDVEPPDGPETSCSEPNGALVELALCIRPFVDLLPDEQAEAIRLVEFEGLTQREAAERVGISVSGMKSRVQRGRVNLRRQVVSCCAIEQDARKSIVAYEPRQEPGCGDCG